MRERFSLRRHPLRRLAAISGETWDFFATIVAATCGLVVLVLHLLGRWRR